jgi:hypothetical protein
MFFFWISLGFLNFYFVMKIKKTFLWTNKTETIIFYKKIVSYSMHSIKNILERNKIDTQSRADEEIG